MNHLSPNLGLKLLLIKIFGYNPDYYTAVFVKEKVFLQALLILIFNYLLS